MLIITFFITERFDVLIFIAAPWCIKFCLFLITIIILYLLIHVVLEKFCVSENIPCRYIHMQILYVYHVNKNIYINALVKNMSFLYYNIFHKLYMVWRICGINITKKKFLYNKKTISIYDKREKYYTI